MQDGNTSAVVRVMKASCAAKRRNAQRGTSAQRSAKHECKKRQARTTLLVVSYSRNAEGDGETKDEGEVGKHNTQEARRHMSQEPQARFCASIRIMREPASAWQELIGA